MRYIQLILFVLGVHVIFAQKAQEIRGIAKERKTAEYYKEQSGLWKNEAKNNPMVSHNWIMYYKAQRAYLQKTDPSWPSNRNVVFEKLRPIIDEAKKTIGDTYEYYIMESINTDSKESIKFALRAYEIAPERTETYETLLIEYVKKGNEEKAEEISKLMLASNYYSNANYKWNYNALQTVEKNGVFITQGDNDSMPRWILQYGLGIRKDVEVVNIWMLKTYEEYRKRIFSKLDITPMEKQISDFSSNRAYIDALLIHILKTSKNASYIGCGGDMSRFKKDDVADDLYLVGTAFRYSTKKLDNLALLKRNFEQNYDLEYLFNEFQIHAEDAMVKQRMNLTYTPGIMKLKEHYALAGDVQKCNYYTKLFDLIAKNSGREAEIRSWYR